MLKKSLVYKISIVLLILGVLFLLNAQVNITGAIIGAPFDPVRNSGIGFALIFISVVLFLIESSGLEEKLDLKKIKKEHQEATNINLTQMHMIDEAKREVLETTKNKHGWLDYYKLDETETKNKAYDKMIDMLTSKRNPFYVKIEGVSKEAAQHIGLRTIGLDPFELKKDIHEYGKDILPRFDQIYKRSQEVQMMQRRMQQLPFRGINQEFVDKHIDEIIKDIVPKGTNLYKKPRTASEAVEIMEEYLEGEGRVSEGFLKRKKYLKEKAA